MGEIPVPIARSLLLVAAVAFTGYAGRVAVAYDHDLIYPRKAPPGVASWAEDLKRGQMLVHVEWAKPPGDGPFPAVMVHPEGGHLAAEMRGAIWDLASRGYLAAAFDYRRLLEGSYEKTLFAWRDAEDPRAAFEILHASPWADGGRIGAVGFSQGGVLSLIASSCEPSLRAVVAYYPVTDFDYWFTDPAYGSGRRFLSKFIRRYFKKQSGAKTEEEFRTVLDRASPLRRADQISAPVLLIHGQEDSTAYVGESRRLEARLRQLSREVRLIEVPGAGHVFNFKDRDQAEEAWRATLEWLDRWVKGARPGGPPNS